MGIPDHEQLPDDPKKTGRREGLSSAEILLQRIVTVGKLMHEQGMSTIEICVWNQLPEQIANNWGYSFRHIYRLVKRAKRLGAELICRNPAENLIQTIQEWAAIKRRSIEIGDMRAACVAQAKISELRDSYVLKAIKKGKIKEKPQMIWAKVMSDDDEVIGLS